MAAAGGGGGGSTQYPNFWGSEPEEEEDYYAAHGVRGSKSFYEVPDGGPTLFTRSWHPLSSAAPRALIFMIHGYGNDISWTFQSTAVFLARSGFACFAADLPGHGRSHGLRAFVPDLDSTLLHLLSFFRSVRRDHQDQDQDRDRDRGGALPCFLFGESMGAASASSSTSAPRATSGPAPSSSPRCARSPTASAPAGPSPDPHLPRPLRPHAPPRPHRRPPRELLRVTDHLGARLPEVTLPFLVVHGSADEVTDPDVSRALYEAARSDDKTIRIYDSMLHSLLFGSPTTTSTSSAKTSSPG
uniref:Serine aminopeptidase S33 domain-containing protein n=1 Tax=Ananas comosus var. bracteatus TaxID=296719 RepID=A0A6V7NM42_ANACO|nr:unnamed protein product [Ananas comosus var. bracteatus]